MFQRLSGGIGSFRSYVRTRAVWNLRFPRLLTFGTLCSKGYERLEPSVPKVVWGNSFVSHAHTLTRARAVRNLRFQRLLTFGTACSKGYSRLEHQVPEVFWGNSFVSRAHTRARGLERKAPKIRNVWNGMFQRLATFGTIRSKGCQRLERYVPKVANV